MNLEYVKITKPGDGEVRELKTVEDFKEFQERFQTGFSLTDKEIELILGYLEGHDYVLGEIDEKLARGDMAECENMICWEKDTMDDVIDAVCEWNYELILDADAKRKNPSDFVDFTNSQSWYDGLKADEAVLDKLFDQSRYGKEIEDFAKKLADELLEKLQKSETTIESKELIEAVAAVSEQVRQYGSGGR